MSSHSHLSAFLFLQRIYFPSPGFAVWSWASKSEEGVNNHSVWRCQPNALVSRGIWIPNSGPWCFPFLRLSQFGDSVGWAGFSVGLSVGTQLLPFLLGWFNDHLPPAFHVFPQGLQMIFCPIRDGACVFVSCLSYCFRGGFQLECGGTEKSICKILKLEVYKCLNAIMIRVSERYAMRVFNSGTCQGLATWVRREKGSWGKSIVGTHEANGSVGQTDHFPWDLEDFVRHFIYKIKYRKP